MTDELCGALKNDDEPCEYTPKYDDGRCGIHTEETDTDPGGRPSKFTDERARAAVGAAANGLSKAGCERAAGVGDGTLNNWLDANPTFETEQGETKEFFRAFRRARSEGEFELIQGGLHDDDVDSSMARFLLSSSFDYIKTEKREQEHSTTDSFWQSSAQGGGDE